MSEDKRLWLRVVEIAAGLQLVARDRAARAAERVRGARGKRVSSGVVAAWLRLHVEELEVLLDLARSLPAVVSRRRLREELLSSWAWVETFGPSMRRPAAARGTSLLGAGLTVVVHASRPRVSAWA